MAITSADCVTAILAAAGRQDLSGLLAAAGHGPRMFAVPELSERRWWKRLSKRTAGGETVRRFAFTGVILDGRARRQLYEITDYGERYLYAEVVESGGAIADVRFGVAPPAPDARPISVRQASGYGY